MNVILVDGDLLEQNVEVIGWWRKLNVRLQMIQRLYSVSPLQTQRSQPSAFQNPAHEACFAFNAEMVRLALNPGELVCEANKLMLWIDRPLDSGRKVDPIAFAQHC